MRAGGAMPCAVVIVTQGEAKARPVLEAAECRKAHPDGYAVATLGDVLRRADIERVAQPEGARTRAWSPRRARRGLSEGRRGARGHPRHAAPGPLSQAVDDGGDARAGGAAGRGGVHDLGSGVRRRALQRHPRGHRSSRRGDREGRRRTSIHRDFDTSRQINQYLADRQDTEFFVQADGALWRMVVDYR